MGVVACAMDLQPNANASRVTLELHVKSKTPLQLRCFPQGYKSSILSPAMITSTLMFYVGVGCCKFIFTLPTNTVLSHQQCFENFLSCTDMVSDIFTNKRERSFILNY